METENTYNPVLRFKEFKDNWSFIPIGDIIQIKSGLGFKASEYSSSGIRLLQIENVGYGQIKWSNNIFLPTNYLDKYPELHLKEKDIVIALNRPVTNNQLKISKITNIDAPSLLYQRVGKIYIKNSNIYYDYIYHIFSFYVKHFVLKQSIGSDQPFISILQLYKFKIPLISIDEQQKIANFLTAIDDKLQQLKKKKQLLEQYKKGVMQQLFTQQLRFTDDNENAYPDWEEIRLGDNAKFFSGGTPISTKEIYYKGNIPFIKSGEINATYTEQFITEEALKNSSAKEVNKGDLLYALYGATSGEVAISKMAGAINQAVLCIRPKFNVVFLYHYFLFKKERILSTFLQGGQGNLSAAIIKELKIPLPADSKEQQKIASFLSSLDNKITSVQTQIQQTQTFKQGLLQQMFV